MEWHKFSYKKYKAICVKNQEMVLVRCCLTYTVHTVSLSNFISTHLAHKREYLSNFHFCID